MFGKGKRPVSLAYKEKLLADIAYYEKRIEEALHKKKHNSSEDVLSSDEDSNPYKVTVGPFPMQLKREEARLSDRTSMTLELAMLTIMQSEVNVMAAAPEVRRPVPEDGTWLEVAAECKIDLVSFTITFYAHKPHRKFAPTRFRSLQVSLTKPAHQQELSQSVLAKLNRPNLALQVLQSYATAFRSRRTTLLELAETYADKLKMEAMPEGGYRVKFLDLLTVEWTLENMWSPVVPFCHRMKFEVEYMPKHFIHAIGKLYKQFKDPSLETCERTRVLAKIFDICSEAQGPARELQDTFQSDPETAGRLHERRTTIDQELEVPSKCDQNVQLSPQKLPKGKENKAQNRKTTMAPPKTLPKKARKLANVNSEAKDVVEDDNISKSSKNNDKVSANEAKKSANDNVSEKRKAVKRALESDAGNAKKKKTDEKNGGKTSQKVIENDEASEPSVSSKNRKKDNKGSSENVGDTVNSKNRKNVDAGKSADSKKSAKTATNKAEGDKNNAETKEKEIDVASKNEAKEVPDVGSGATSKTAKKTDANSGRVVSAKKQSTESTVPSSKKGKTVDIKSVVSSKSKNGKGKGESSNVLSKNVNNNKSEGPSKNLTDKSSGNSKNKNASEKDSNKCVKNKLTEVAEKNKANNEKKVQKDVDKEKQSKVVTKDKVIVHKNSEVSKQNENLDITEKSGQSKENTDKASKSSDKNSESQKDAMKNKVTNTRNTENRINHKTETSENKALNVKEKESFGKKIIKVNSEATKTIKNDANRKKALTVVEKSKITVSKVSNAKHGKIEGATSKDDRVEKVDSNKFLKASISNIKNQNKDNADKPRNINAKTVPEITKSNILKTNMHTENPNLRKIKETQAKDAEKLKTRIPMMKSKLKIGNFKDSLPKTETKLGKSEKTKIPLKSLPVFKKIIRDPTRMSPRKLLSAAKPSSEGYSIK